MMTTERGEIMKELHKLVAKAHTLYDGQVEFDLDEQDDEDYVRDSYGEHFLNTFFYITPKDGPYKNARIKFCMHVNLALYPTLAPQVGCRNNIYHPNVSMMYTGDVESYVCVSLLESDWEAAVGLDGTIMAVLFLFYHPEMEDAMNEMCYSKGDMELFERNVRRSLRGKDVDEFVFDKLLDDDSLDSYEEEAGESEGLDQKENNFLNVIDDVTEDDQSSLSRTKAICENVRGEQATAATAPIKSSHHPYRALFSWWSKLKDYMYKNLQRGSKI